MIKKIFLSLLRWILGPKWGAALEGGEKAYEAEDRKEEAAVIHRKAAEMYTIQSEVETRKEQAHAKVANSSDPDAVVDEQLRELGLVDERSAGEDAGATGPSAPAGGKSQGG